MIQLLISRLNFVFFFLFFSLKSYSTLFSLFWRSFVSKSATDIFCIIQLFFECEIPAKMRECLLIFLYNIFLANSRLI